MKPFIENTLAGTIGTIIGIVLTIGTTYLATRIETRKSEKQQVQMLVKGLEQNIESFELLAKDMECADSLNNIIIRHRDDLSVLADSTLQEWGQYMFFLNIKAIDLTAARIFSSNIETWRNISSPEFIDYMGRSFSIIEKLVELNTRHEDAFFKAMYEKKIDNTIALGVTNMPQEDSMVHSGVVHKQAALDSGAIIRKDSNARVDDLHIAQLGASLLADKPSMVCA